MGLRKALAYSKKRARPYTRNSRKKDKSYIKTIPGSKIVKFEGGSLNDYRDGKHKFGLSLVSEQKVQIRDNALESCRMALTKKLDELIIGQYYMIVKVHPHHLLRENKSAAAVAGADRISTGMTQAFGVVIGRAAMVHAGQELFFISCTNEKAAQITKEALNTIKSKVPCKTRVIFQKLG